MGFAQEIKDFTSTFIAMRKQAVSEQQAGARAKYYDAMIGLKGANNASLAGSRAQRNAIAAGALGVKKALLPFQQDALKARAEAARAKIKPADDLMNPPGFDPNARPSAVPVGPQSSVYDPTDPEQQTPEQQAALDDEDED